MNLEYQPACPCVNGGMHLVGSQPTCMRCGLPWRRCLAAIVNAQSTTDPPQPLRLPRTEIVQPPSNPCADRANQLAAQLREARAQIGHLQKGLSQLNGDNTRLLQALEAEREEHALTKQRLAREVTPDPAEIRKLNDEIARLRDVNAQHNADKARLAQILGELSGDIDELGPGELAKIVEEWEADAIAEREGMADGRPEPCNCAGCQERRAEVTG